MVEDYRDRDSALAALLVDIQVAGIEIDRTMTRTEARGVVCVTPWTEAKIRALRAIAAKHGAVMSYVAPGHYHVVL